MKRHDFLFLSLCLLIFATSGFAQNTKTTTALPDIAAQTTQTVKYPELREELLKRIKNDQAIRAEVKQNYPPGKPLPSEVVERFRAIDRENTSRMKEIIKQYGYPGYSLVGRDGEQLAFVMIQHADQDLEFQKQCLELLRKAVESKDASPSSLAYLMDRVLVAEGKLQRYGTQMQMTDGVLKPSPVEDEANLDKRRAEMGLTPMAEYMKLIQSRSPKPNR